eukprot:CAMPEP_0116891626 /NCGR_PEP_ID=MMETSP0467-20121206/1991_1 /TAXON_ID=283647 /ORGANISM="Mesodinium pulex, Strain SPMC105" /LENGTH=110 /DNA_ID=CAMNT_0004560227 /DNA_START=532 /DNA_END=861 /DNA_ORIENTATION=+
MIGREDRDDMSEHIQMQNFDISNYESREIDFNDFTLVHADGDTTNGQGTDQKGRNSKNISSLSDTTKAKLDLINQDITNKYDQIDATMQQNDKIKPSKISKINIETTNKK